VRNPPPAVATHVYQACLLLYPSTFRLEFGDEMVSDFDEATGDAWRMRGWAGVLALWALVVADLVHSAAAQWLRTGLPVLIALSAFWTTMMCTLIAQQLTTRAPILPPPRTPEEEMKIMIFGTAVVVVLIAAIILVTGWFWMLVVRRKRRA
jgi:hypothetical protein